MRDVGRRPPAHLAPDTDDGGELGPVGDGSTSQGLLDTLRIETPPWEEAVAEVKVRGYTGTSCPECQLAQMWCPGGVTCPNGHGFAGRSAAPTEVEGIARAARCPTNRDGSEDVGPVTPIRKGSSTPYKSRPGPVLPDHGVAPVPIEPEPVPEPEPASEPAPKPKRRKLKVVTGDRSPVVEVDQIADESYRRKQREAVARRLDELVLGDGYERIIEHVFTIDPWAAYEELQKRLTLPVPAHAQTKTLLFDELDAAEQRAKEAHQLFVSAKETVRRFDVDIVVLSVDMRQQATAALQREKDAGQRSKQITDSDVESRMASMFPDEWRQTEMRRSRAKLMVDHMGRLSDAWKERARDLRSMFDGK